MTISAVIFAAIGTSLYTAFIPIYQEVMKNNGKKAANKFTNNVLNAVILICIVFSILGLIFTPQIVHVFAMGFEGNLFNQTVYFTRVMILGLAFLGMSYIMITYLKVKGNLVISVLIGVAVNQISNIIDRTIASTLVEGSITSLDFAAKLN